MKKLSLLIAFMLLVGISTSVQATVDVTCFAGIFERATGVPVAETVYFPGVAGSATIRVYNGAEACSVQSNNIFFIEDFETGSAQTFLSDYHQAFSQGNGYSVQSSVVASGNYAGRYTFYQGQPGTGYATQHIGDSPRSPVINPGNHFNDIYIQFKLMYSSGFDFSAGNNKFMIIGTEDSRSHPKPCCNPPVAHYITLYAEQDSGGYFFNLEGNNKKDTNSDRWYYPYIERAYIQPGHWHTIEVRLRLNDTNQKNGIYQMWVDGNQVADYNNILYRAPWDGTYGSDFNYGTNFVMLSTYTNSGVSQQQHFYYDDIMFSTSYIGIVASTYCGDSICNNGETPTSCSKELIYHPLSFSLDFPEADKREIHLLW